MGKRKFLITGAVAAVVLLVLLRLECQQDGTAAPSLRASSICTASYANFERTDVRY